MESCRQALTEFETRYPVSFAIELEQVYEEKAATAETQYTLATKMGPGKLGSTSTVSAGSSLGIPADSKSSKNKRVPLSASSTLTKMRQNQGAGQRKQDPFPEKTEKRDMQQRRPSAEKQPVVITDEADTYKKMRRQSHYRECARQFIRYFTDSGISPTTCNILSIFAKHRNCIAKFGYCNDVLSVCRPSVCDASVL